MSSKHEYISKKAREEAFSVPDDSVFIIDLNKETITKISIEEYVLIRNWTGIDVRFTMYSAQKLLRDTTKKIIVDHDKTMA